MEYDIGKLYRDWDITVREFIHMAEQMKALGAVEIGKSLLLYGMKLYEDLLASELTYDQQIEFLKEMHKRTHLIINHTATMRSMTECDLTRYDWSKHADD